MHSRRCLCTNQAAALSFDTLLALVPFLILAFNVLSFFPLNHAMIQETEVWVLTHLLNDESGALTHSFKQLLIQSRHLSLFSSVGLLFSIWLLMHNLQESLVRIWKIEQSPKHFLVSFLYGLAMLCIPLVLCYSLMASTFLSAWLPFTSHLLSMGTCMLWLFCTYRLLPQIHVPWPGALIGALCATLTLTLLRNLLLAYFSWFHAYTLIYGAFVSIPIFLVWLFSIWLVILLGSILSYVWTIWSANDLPSS